MAAKKKSKSPAQPDARDRMMRAGHFITKDAVEVRALRPLNEPATGHHNKGDVFKVSPDRAKALSGLVAPVVPPNAAAPRGNGHDKPDDSED